MTKITNYYNINPNFALKQGIETQEKIDEINNIHNNIKKTLEVMKLLNPDNEDELNDLRNLDKFITSCDFILQELWGFEQNINYHTWWLREPHCKCPSMDNRDPIYYGRGKIINSNCPIHGYK